MLRGAAPPFGQALSRVWAVPQFFLSAAHAGPPSVCSRLLWPRLLCRERGRPRRSCDNKSRSGFSWRAFDRVRSRKTDKALDSPCHSPSPVPQLPARRPGLLCLSCCRPPPKGLIIPSARFALSLASEPYACVLGRKRVAPMAMAFSIIASAERLPPQYVDSLCHCLKVSRVAARADSAQMVNDQPGRDRAEIMLIHQPMDKLHPPAISHLPVTNR